MLVCCGRGHSSGRQIVSTDDVLKMNVCKKFREMEAVWQWVAYLRSVCTLSPHSLRMATGWVRWQGCRVLPTARLELSPHKLPFQFLHCSCNFMIVFWNSVLCMILFVRLLLGSNAKVWSFWWVVIARFLSLTQSFFFGCLFCVITK